MKHSIKIDLDQERERITAVVYLSDDDRNRWIRSAKIDVSIPKEEVMNLPLQDVEKKMLDQAYDFLSQALSARKP
jgi:hypothetical protein